MRSIRTRALRLALAALACLAGRAGAEELPFAEGYLGIWYSNQPSGDEYRFKYSGGFGTYPQQHVPIAVYSKAANKTFFALGGRTRAKNELLHLVGYFDHATGRVSRPRVLLNKKTSDAHDNPTLALDAAGHIWVFSNAHGTSRPAFIHRSLKPRSVDGFERIAETNFSYGQPWHLGERGFLFLHTRYDGGRILHWMTSPDGRAWSGPRRLAGFGEGHYQVSWPRGERVGTMFNYHPKPGGLNKRTNLYYLATADAGGTWVNAKGEPLALPPADKANPALVRDYESEGLLVYLKDIQYDAEGRPILFYLTSGGYASGPASGRRVWRTARWDGADWVFHDAFESDHNYDFGSLYAEADDLWRAIVPTDPGPQPGCTGGEMVMWLSRDRGETWTETKKLTPGSARNHTYARRPLGAAPGFYALWADGNALEESESRFYFTDREGSGVWRLPERFDADEAAPERAW